MPYYNLKLCDLQYVFRVRLTIVLAMAFPLLSCHTQSTLRQSSEPSMSEIQYDVYGEGPSVMILLHGLGSNKKAWKKVVPYLEDSHKIYALDLPKYLNTDDKTGVGISKYAALVKSFIDKLPQSKAHIVGHSMGAQIAMHLGLNHPNNVLSLSLLAPAGIEQFSEADKNWFKTYVTKNYYLTLNDAAVKRSFDINFFGNALPKDAQFMLEDRMALKEDSVAYSRYIDYVLLSINSMLEEAVYQDLDQLQIPTLVLFGANDQLIPNRLLHPGLNVEDILEKAQKIQSSNRLLVSEAGHFIQWDKPEEVASQINKFIANLFTKK